MAAQWITAIGAGLLLLAPANSQPAQNTSIATTLTAEDFAARAATKPITARKIILVGDSTTALQGGWGPAFCAHHVSQSLVCINLARGGRSTYSFRAEGSWDLTLKEVRSGGYSETYVLIQFGHNDQPGKPGRSTDLKTEFSVNLSRYVDEAREAGAIPVLLTPLTRRAFRNGVLEDDLAPWAEATRKVAADRHVPLVDLYALSRAEVEKLGPVDAMNLALISPSPELITAAHSGTSAPVSLMASSPAPQQSAGSHAASEPLGQPKRAFDYTHIGPAGAEVFATLIARELSRAVPSLRRDLFDSAETAKTP